MKKKEIISKNLDEKYFHFVHPTGLNIYIYPKEDYNSTYVLFGTNFGSVNNKFKVDGKEIIEVPDGIAHYLEHKLFECEDGDAFVKYAKTGASANAYTSFEKTAYLFSCSQNFEESLNILLDFVQTPYFTDETVKKEQGIIGQEIKMYEDSPDWNVLFNLLKSLYHNHPVKIDIAGTVESIAEITPKKLYDCYNAFYNLNNMALCIAGKVDVDKTLMLIDKKLKPSKAINVEKIFPDEPNSIVTNRVEREFDVLSPIFNMGYKQKVDKEWMDTKDIAYIDIILYAVASKSSPMYQKLLNDGLINTSSFSYEHFEGPWFSSIIFSGESRDPDLVSDIIRNELYKISKTGIDEVTFNRAKKAVYGANVANFNSVSSIANALLGLAFSNRELFNYVDHVANANLQEVNEKLKGMFNKELSALSIISPKKKN